MSNPNIGEYDCEACEKAARKNTKAFVRQDKNGKLYGLCPRCGKVTRGNPQGQDYFLNVARLYDPEQRAAEAARVTPAPEPAPLPQNEPEVPEVKKYIAPSIPAPQPVPTPARSFFDDLI